MIAAWDAIGTFSHLKALQINGMGWRTRGTSHSPGIKNLAKTPELQHLLINYGRVDVEDLKVIGGLVHLQELKPWGLDFDDSALEGLAGLQELRVLDIQSPGWSLKGVVAISRLQNLEELQVRPGLFGDDKMQPLQSLSKLKWLNVQGTEVTSVGAATLQKKLPACQVLISPPKGK
jgi:hypothetical protein